MKAGKQWPNFTRRLPDEAGSVKAGMLARLAAEKPVQRLKEHLGDTEQIHDVIPAHAGIQ